MVKAKRKENSVLPSGMTVGSESHRTHPKASLLSGPASVDSVQSVLPKGMRGGIPSKDAQAARSETNVGGVAPVKQRMAPGGNPGKLVKGLKPA